MQRMYVPKNEDVCENIEHKKNEYREISTMARGNLSPWAAANAESVGEESANRRHIYGREETGRVAKTVEEQREATKSGGLVQGRKDAACQKGCRIAGSLVSELSQAQVDR
jgi:hypothetical protein